MNKKIIILITMVILAYTVIGIVLYDLCRLQVMTVDDYSLDGKWCIDHNITEGTYFCTENNGYKKGDKILVLYNIDDLFSFNIISW